ncbi:signal peptidase II [Nannocystaceae bacterium ST9]
MGLAATSVLLDQLSKQWAHATLRGGEPIVMIADVLEFDYAFNPGSAFGMFAQQGGARPMFLLVAMAALVYMVWLVRRMPTEARFGFAALGLMFGGALGNMLDRLLRVDEVRLRFHDQLHFDTLIEHPTRIAEALGKGRAYTDVPRHGVIDFIVVHLGGERPWPAFNLADASLVVGVALLLLTLVRHGAALTGGEAHEAG